MRVGLGFVGDTVRFTDGRGVEHAVDREALRFEVGEPVDIGVKARPRRRVVARWIDPQYSNSAAWMGFIDERDPLFDEVLASALSDPSLRSESHPWRGRLTTGELAARRSAAFEVAGDEPVLLGLIDAADRFFMNPWKGLASVGITPHRAPTHVESMVGGPAQRPVDENYVGGLERLESSQHPGVMLLQEAVAAHQKKVPWQFLPSPDPAPVQRFEVAATVAAAVAIVAVSVWLGIYVVADRESFTREGQFTAGSILCDPSELRDPWTGSQACIDGLRDRFGVSSFDRWVNFGLRYLPFVGGMFAIGLVVRVWARRNSAASTTAAS